MLGDISTGASNDIERATQIARAMVTKYGMSERLGPICYGSDNNEVFIGRDMEMCIRDRVGILKGCFMFMADLMRYVEVPCQMDFMICSSYGAGTESSGQIKIVKDLSVPIQDCHVLIVEDIIDSGNTLCYVKNLLKERRCV